METPKTLRYYKFIITCFISCLIAFFSPFVTYAQTQDVEKCIEVSSFDEFTSSLNQIQSTGGTVVLTQDITVPAEESYVYINARYRKEVVIETKGHTINVEGYLELWPFLTIRGNGSQKELFHVYPGGELWLTGICLDAGENGIAVIQEEGSFLTYGSEESMDFPAFSCTGQIISSQTMTAAAYWRYHCEKLPIVCVPEGTDFTADMLPDQILSIVNRDHQEYEEQVPVVWDETTFPTEHERTLVQGKFAEGYSQYKVYMPRCLIIWESDTSPFFLNVYLESATQWCDTVFMHGESLQPGTVSIQSSDDGEAWTDILGTDGYAPVKVTENESFSWILSYDQLDSSQERPRYYRLLQTLDDGTELYSEALELGDDLIFTAANIEGGRGGETSPNEGENQLPDDMPEMDETESSKTPDLSSDLESQEQKNGMTGSAGHSDAENPKELSDSNISPTLGSILLPNEIPVSIQPEEGKHGQKAESIKTKDEQLEPAKTDDQILSGTDAEKMAGVVIVVCILVGSVAFFAFKRKLK